MELHSLPAALILYDPMQSKRVNTNTSARSVHDPPLNYTATLEDMCPFEGFKHGLCLWFLDLPPKTAVLRWVLSLTRSVSAAHQECREEEWDGGGDVRLCVVLWSSRRSTITAKVKSEAPASFFFFFFLSLPPLCSDVRKLQLHVRENKCLHVDCVPVKFKSSRSSSSSVHRALGQQEGLWRLVWKKSGNQWSVWRTGLVVWSQFFFFSFFFFCRALYLRG